MRQRDWEAWVAEITDCNTHRKAWIGSFQSPEQAAYAYGLENRQKFDANIACPSVK
jgi:hypothetical protein